MPLLELRGITKRYPGVTALDLLGVPAFWQEIAKGAIILLAVLFDVWTKREGEARRHA